MDGGDGRSGPALPAPPGGPLHPSASGNLEATSHRVFATVDGYQDRLVLSGRVWIDDPCLTDTDIVRGSGFVQKRVSL